MSTSNNTAIKTAASLVDQLEALKTVRDQAAVLQQSGQVFLNIGLAMQIPGDNGSIATGIAQTLQQAMGAELATNFISALDQAAAQVQGQLDSQIKLINERNTTSESDSPQS